MNVLYVVMGKSASGKDTIYGKLMNSHPELAPVIPYTTRPIREGEREGEEYRFVDRDEMLRMEAAGEIIESRCYHTVRGDWYYFTAADEQFDRPSQGHVMISTLEGYEKLRDYFGSRRVVPIYIEVPDFIRIDRALGREKKQERPCVAEVCRRYLADEEDFSEEKLTRAGISRRIDNSDLEEAMMKIEQILAKNEKI